MNLSSNKEWYTVRDTKHWILKVPDVCEIDFLQDVNSNTSKIVSVIIGESVG